MSESCFKQTIISTFPDCRVFVTTLTLVSYFGAPKSINSATKDKEIKNITIFHENNFPSLFGAPKYAKNTGIKYAKADFEAPRLASPYAAAYVAYMEVKAPGIRFNSGTRNPFLVFV